MTELYVIGRMQIHDGQLEAFESTAQKCVDIVRGQDTGTLQYDWYYDADRSGCVAHERYVYSDALLEHMGHLGDLLSTLLGLADFSAEVYGSPSQAILDASEGMDVALYDHAYGI